MKRFTNWAVPLLRMPRRSFPVLLLAAMTCTAQGADVSFSRDIRPLLVQNCASCHQGAAAPAGLSLLPKDAYANLVGVVATESTMLRVASSDAGASYLLHKLDGTHVEAGGQGAAMPLSAPALAPAQIESIRKWVAAGAPNN